MKKAVVLLSGGLDSTTCLALAKSQGFACYALSFSYGQRHSAELCAATRIAKHMGAADHKIVTLDIALFGGSALTDASIEVPEFKESPEIPVTYVPARNTIFWLWLWVMLNQLVPEIFLLVPVLLIIPIILIVARSLLNLSNLWQTWQRKQELKAIALLSMLLCNI